MCRATALQVSQTDYREDGEVFGSVLNHVTDGRWATGATASLLPTFAWDVYKQPGPSPLSSALRQSRGYPRL